MLLGRLPERAALSQLLDSARAGRSGGLVMHGQAGSRQDRAAGVRDVVLAFAVARLWTGVLSNALEPGWVPTRMGGPGAPDDMSLAPVIQAWLAVSSDPDATVTGGYFYHQKPRTAHLAARDPKIQDRLLRYCAALTGVTLARPRSRSA